MSQKSVRIPRSVLICCAVLVAAQAAVYYAVRLPLPYLTQHVLTGPLDARIPFSPPWIVIYCLAFPFWLGSGLWIFMDGKPLAYRFTASYVLALLLSGAVYLIWPGTLVRPAVVGDDLFAAWVRLIYRIDSPTNLCPSLHVLLSWFCLRGALDAGSIPRWYKAFSAVFFLLVCCSVLFVKQHALIDVPAGVAFGELALQCGRIFRLERIPFAIEQRFRKE